MMTDETVINWAAGWVSDETPGYRDLFLGGLRSELEQRAAAMASAEQRGYRRGVDEAAREVERLPIELLSIDVADTVAQRIRAIVAPVEPKGTP